MQISGAAPQSTSVHFGVLKLAPATPGGMIAVKATGLGLVPGAGGATLGFARSQMVFMNDISRCSLVIFEAGNDPPSRAFWASAIESAQQACIEGGNGDVEFTR